MKWPCFIDLRGRVDFNPHEIARSAKGVSPSAALIVDSVSVDILMSAGLVEVDNGRSYVGDSPLLTSPDEETVERPAPPLSAEAIALKRENQIKANSRTLWDHVESRISADEQKALIAVRLLILDRQTKSLPVNALAVSLLDGMQNWINTCMMAQSVLSQQVLAADVALIESIEPDLSTFPAPEIKSAGDLTYLLFSG